MSDKKKFIIAHIDTAITIAKMGIDAKDSLEVRIAANGPTIGEVIDRALALVSLNTDEVDQEIAHKNNELVSMKERLLAN